MSLIRAMYFGIVRQLRDERKIDFSSTENREIASLLGAVNKSLRKLEKGGLPKKSDALIFDKPGNKFVFREDGCW